MEKAIISILYIDDESNNLLAFKANFRRDYSIFTAESAKEGLEILKNNTIQIIITDQRMPLQSGVEFLESILTDFPDPIRILLTGYSDMEVIINAVNKGQIFRYLSKPFNEIELKMAIENAAEVYKLREENRELLKKLISMNEQLEFMLRQKLLS